MTVNFVCVCVFRKALAIARGDCFKQFQEITILGSSVASYFFFKVDIFCLPMHFGFIEVVLVNKIV